VRHTYSHDGDGNRIRTYVDDGADGTTDEIIHHHYNEAGYRIRNDYDTDLDGTIDLGYFFGENNDGWNFPLWAEHYSYDEDGNRSLTRVDYLGLDGSRFRADVDTDGDGDLDLVKYEGRDIVYEGRVIVEGIAYSGDFPNHAGLELVRLDGAGTELTIPDAFVFAGNGDPATPVRIEGSGVDTLRFDRDDFTQGDNIYTDGNDYLSFAADDGTWSFLVDVDVTLFDI